MSKPGKKDNFRSQFSYCWLSLTLVVLSFKNLKFRLKYVLQYSVKRKYQNIQKIIYSGYCKNWLLCSIWDICRYYWLQAITNSFANLFYFFPLANYRHKNNTVLKFNTRNDNFSGTFCMPEPGPGPNVRKILGLICSTLVKNQTLCFSWMRNCPNIGAFIVRTVSNIFASALEKRCWRNAANI